MFYCPIRHGIVSLFGKVASIVTIAFRYDYQPLSIIITDRNVSSVFQDSITEILVSVIFPIKSIAVVHACYFLTRIRVQDNLHQHGGKICAGIIRFRSHPAIDGEKMPAFANCQLISRFFRRIDKADGSFPILRDLLPCINLVISSFPKIIRLDRAIIDRLSLRRCNILASSFIYVAVKRP